MNPGGLPDNQSNYVSQNNNSQKQTINNITIVQQTSELDKSPDQPIAENKKSDVDVNIPTFQLQQKNTFALIIANEHYDEVSNVPNALNDGTVFAEYCQKTLGIPQNNIKYVKDATLNGIQRQIIWLTQVMEVYQGEASVIVYYAGHGIPDESSKSSYLLPVDGYGNDINTGYGLDK